MNQAAPVPLGFDMKKLRQGTLRKLAKLKEDSREAEKNIDGDTGKTAEQQQKALRKKVQEQAVIILNDYAQVIDTLQSAAIQPSNGKDNAPVK